MGLFDLFKGKKKRAPDPLHDLSLSNLQPGYYVDYDLKTWEVVAYNRYDWGEGDVSHEWQLKDGEGEVVYLEKESDDEDDWSLNRKIELYRLGPRVREQIIETEDPPDQVIFEGSTYYLEETAGGYFLKDGKGAGQEMLRWSYEDDEGRYICIEQWGEEDFEASSGIAVEEYQFTNILPAA